MGTTSLSGGVTASDINGKEVYAEILEEIELLKNLDKGIATVKNTRQHPTAVKDAISRSKARLEVNKHKIDVYFRLLDKVVPNVSSIRIQEVSDEGEVAGFSDAQLIAAVKTGRELERAMSKVVTPPTKKKGGVKK